MAEHRYDPKRDRAPLAEGVGRRADVGGRQRGRRVDRLLRARDAPVPERRAAHRPPEELHDRRRGRPLPPPHRPARAAPDGLRRVRPARREPRDQDRPAPARLDRGVDRRVPASSSAAGASRSTGRASSARTSRATTAGRSGSSSSSSRPAWPTARRRRSTGARSTRPCSPTSRSSTGAASAAATRSRSASSSSGSSASPTTPSGCCATSTRSSGPSTSRRCSATGSGARRAPRSSFRCEELGIDYPVFTTRPDTLFGATFFVMAPEHPDVLRLAEGTAALRRGPRLRQPRGDRVARRSAGTTERQKTGVPLGRDGRQPGQRRADPDVRRRLRADGVRDRRDHGRARARPARLRLRARSSTCRSARSSRRRRATRSRRRGVRRAHRGRDARQLRRVRRA